MNTRTVRSYSQLGCKDTSNTLTFTRFNNPVVGLTISDPDFEVCKGTNIIFTGKGASTYQLYKNDTIWLSSFNTNIGSSNFKSTDKIKVIGKDLNTCFASSIPFSIKVNPLPKVGFTVNDGCDKDSISFINQTTDTATYVWKFGDGTKSISESPKHGSCSSSYNNI